MMKLRITTGVGLLLFTATMIDGPVWISRAQANDGGATLASLAGKFTSKGSGSYTACFNASFSAPVDCVSAPHEVPFDFTAVSYGTRDAAGNSCGVTSTVSALRNSPTDAPVLVTKFPPAKMIYSEVGTTTSFDPTTGSGTARFSQYRGGRCIGAAFDNTGAVLTITGTLSFMVSDSGNRIQTIVTSFSAVLSPFFVAGSMKETMPLSKATSIRQSD